MLPSRIRWRTFAAPFAPLQDSAIGATGWYLDAVEAWYKTWRPADALGSGGKVLFMYWTYGMTVNPLFGGEADEGASFLSPAGY